MQLRAAAGSEALVARLTQAVQSTPIDSVTNSSVLYSELRYEAKQNVDKALCNATGFPAVGTNIVPAGSPLGTISEPGVANNIVLPAAGDTVTDGAAVDICFALTLPSSAADTLQGLKTVPLWKFTSTVGS
jgi:hypothetical protein